MNKKAIPTPALKRAGDYLAAALGSGAWKPGDRLPPFAALAKLAGVAPVTMWKAISACKAQGKLTVERGRWISVGPPVTSAIPPPPYCRDPRRWEMVKQAMSRDILLGRLPLWDGLLNTKELCKRYGCSYIPLRMALAKLVDEGLLQHDRRSFRLPSPSRPDSLVQFQWGTSSPYSRKNIPAYIIDFQKILEKKCWEHGQQLVHIYPGSSAGKHRASIAGTVLWTSGETEQESAFLRSQRRVGKPVAWITPDSMEAGVPQKRPFRLLKTFCFDQKAAGWNLGRHLLEMGWKRVLFFTHMERAPFSQLRRQGLAEVFTSAGYASAVHELPFSLDDFDYGRELGAFCQKFLRREVNIFDTSNTFHSLFNGLHIYHIVYHQAICARLCPVIDKALAAGGEAAWVGVNDELALEILQFLREKDTGSGTPHFTVAGFDNLVQAAQMNLTSYDFHDDLANQVLSHILQPSRFAEEFPAPMVMVQGDVVERQTLNVSPAS